MFSRIKNFLLTNHGTKQTVIKNTFWVATGTTLAKVMRATIIILAARKLGTDGYGIFSYALSIAGIFMVLSDIGLTSILTRELSKEGGEKQKYLSTVLTIKLAFLGLATFLIGVVGPLISRFEEAKPLLIIVAFSIAFENLRGFFYATKRSENKMESEAGANIMTEALSTLLVIFVFFYHPTAMRLAGAYLIGNTIGLIGSLIYLRGHFTGVFKHFDRKLVRIIVLAAAPFAIMNISSIFLTNIDSLMIGFYGTTHDLGLYAAAQRPISLLYILPNFIGVSLFPIVSRMVGKGSTEGTKHFIAKAYIVTMAIALPITLGGIILAGPLINVTFSHDYISAVSVFQVLLLTIPLVFAGTVFSDFLLAEDKQKIFVFSSIAGSIANVGLNFLLIPTYGIIGSAVATVIAQLFINGIFYFEMRKAHGLHLFGGLGKIIIATIVVAGITYLLKSWSVPILVIILVCAAVYPCFLVLLKDRLALEVRSVLRSH